MMIKLYSFGKEFGVADPSPFVLKVDVYCRMAGIKFKSISSADNLRKAPKGKLPFIIDDDVTVSDSQFIIDYLQDKYKVDLDSHLSEQQKAFAYHLGQSLNEDLYWCVVYSRWARDDTWPLLKEAFFGSMPFPLKYIVPILAQKGVKSALFKQGLGRHSDEEIRLITQKALQALSTILGDKSYFFGDKLCTFDATAYGILAQLVSSTIDNPYNDMAKKYTNLVGYCERITQQYY
jgi:glutathione S-transferase